MQVFPLSLLILFGLSLVVQLFWYLVRFGRVARAKPLPVASKLPPVSIIVSAHNASGLLQKLIPALLEQQYPEFEIVVVDDRSTDYTDTWLSEQQLKDRRVRHVRIDNTPAHFTAKKYAITMGIKHARYDALILTDADCVPNSPAWLANMVSPLANGKKISLGYSPMYAKPGLLNALIRFETVVTALQYLGAALGKRPYMGVGRNLAYSKALFLEKKGFLSHRNVMGGDDDLFVNKNATSENTQAIVGADSLVWTTAKENWSSWWRQKRRHTAAGKYYRWSTRLGLGFFLLAQWLFWITFALLLSLGIEPIWVLACLVLKEIVLYTIVCSATKKLGDSFCPWHLFLLEILLMLFQTVVGLSVLFSKPSSWK